MSKRLHILFLCSWYPSRVFKANGDFIQRHAQSVGLKHKVSVFHIVSDPQVTKIDIQVNSKDGLTEYIAYIKPSSFFFVKWLRFWSAFQILLQTIEPFDAVHVNRLFPMGIFALYLKKKRKINYIISEHWTGYHFTDKKPLSWFEKRMSKRIVERAYAVCPVSDNLRDSMIKTGLQGNYVRVPNVVNTELFSPKTIEKDGFVITHISDLNDDHKNISGMLQTASKLSNIIPNFTWNFIGGKKDTYIKLMSSLDFGKANIRFMDHVDHKKIPDYLSQSHVFVLFSNYENLPCVILEAFSCGIPVISTNVGGIREFFPKKFGYLIQPKNQEELIEKIQAIYKNPISLENEMNTYAVENFSPEKICDSFTKLYLEARKHQP